MQTHQTCACSCVCTHTCSHTAYRMHTHTHTTCTHTHTTCTLCMHSKCTHKTDTQQAPTAIHTIDTLRNFVWDFFVCLGPYTVASKCLAKAEGSSFEYNMHTTAEDYSIYHRWPLSFPLLGRASTPNVLNSRHVPRFFYLSEAAVWRPLRWAATNDAGKPQCKYTKPIHSSLA